MKSRLWPVICGLSALASCSNAPPSYAPLPQRRTIAAGTIPRGSRMIEMNAPSAEQHFVRDITTGPADSWRWTQRRPTVRVNVTSVKGWKYHIDFTIPDVTFKQTGPVTLTFYVNDREIAKQRYDAPGTKMFEAKIPPDWLKENADNTLAAEVDKTYYSRDDGAELGMILSRMGLAN